MQVLPFENLSNSKELSVRNYQAVNDILNNNKEINIASLSSLANDLAEKLDLWKILALTGCKRLGYMHIQEAEKAIAAQYSEM